MDIKDIREVYKLSLLDKKIASNYLNRRKLKNSAIKPFGYISKFTAKDIIIIDSIVLPILDLELKLVGLECRSLKDEGTTRYNKLFSDDLSVPVYGLRNPNFTSEYVFITEGIFDCESILQLGFNAITGLRASPPKLVLHFIALFYDKIIIAFDNDLAGIRNAKKIIAFYDKHYPSIEMEVLEYKGSDINDAKIRYVNSLRNSIKKIIGV